MNYESEASVVENERSKECDLLTLGVCKRNINETKSKIPRNAQCMVYV